MTCKRHRSRAHPFGTSLSTLAAALAAIGLLALTPATGSEAEIRPTPRPEMPVRAPRPVPKPDPDLAEIKRPEPRWRPDTACTVDGGYCVTPIRYLFDVCKTVEGVSEDHGLDPYFMARLLWRESRFDPLAVSPAGAMGIAQFMPGTAKLRGLDDPFNPAEAMQRSAAYLSELASEFGSIGLAAAAYNGGEARLSRYLNDKDDLPLETRAYVRAITGLPIEAWVKDPKFTPKLAPADETSFHASCMAYANKAPTLASAPAQNPWAMIYSAHPRLDIAIRRARWIKERFPDLLAEADASPRRMRLPGQRRAFYAAQVGHPTKVSATEHCDRLRSAGGSCMILRN